jgi:hypothetical protein
MYTGANRLTIGMMCNTKKSGPLPPDAPTARCVPSMRRPVFQTDTNGGIITKAPTDGEHARARALAKINPVSVADISHFAVDEVPPEHVVNPERDQRKTKHTPGVTHLRKPGSGSDLYQFSHRPLASSRAVVRPPIARPSDQLDHAQMHSAPRCHGALPAPARSPTSCAENYPPAGRRHHPIRMTPATNHARTSLNLTARRGTPHKVSAPGGLPSTEGHAFANRDGGRLLSPWAALSSW